MKKNNCNNFFLIFEIKNIFKIPLSKINFKEQPQESNDHHEMNIQTQTHKS